MRRALLAMIPVLWLLGCSSAADRGESAATGVMPIGPSALNADATPDVEGQWTWSNVEVLRFPPFVAAMVGVEPEGPNTHARCESGGTMTLLQTGAAFSGTATRLSNACRTNRGQTFQQPGTLFQVTDGRIAGRSARFSFSSPPVAPCPHQAVISETGGTAVSLAGTGHCILPGHPQSDSPIAQDPPSGGTSTTIAWNAVRVGP